MLAPVYSITDFVTACRNLLPRGRAWSRDPSSVMTAFLSAIAAFTVACANRAGNLLADAFPGSTLELLSTWESTLGLPDPCAGLSPTIEQRRAQVVARFAGGFAPSVPNFINYAAQLGYTITISEFAPFRCGFNTCGQPLYGVAWANAWQINDPAFTVTFFEVGQNVCGDPLAVWGNTVLACESNRFKPAHTVLLFTN